MLSSGRACDAAAQRSTVKRLGDEGVDARCVTGLNVFRLFTAGEHHDVRLRRKAIRADPLAQFNAIHPGHFPIKNADVDATSLEQCLRFSAIFGGNGFITPDGERSFHQPEGHRFIFRNQYLESWQFVYNL